MKTYRARITIMAFFGIFIARRAFILLQTKLSGSNWKRPIKRSFKFENDLQEDFLFRSREKFHDIYMKAGSSYRWFSGTDLVPGTRTILV